jgi:hypothetical protein
MQRRQVLAGLGAATLTAGCGGLLNTPCEPGERELGALHDEVLDMGNPGTVSIRGTIVRMQEVSVVVADGTGYAIVDAPFGKKFNEDWVQEGDCVEVSATVQAAFSREYGHLELEIDSGAAGVDVLAAVDLQFEVGVLAAERRLHGRGHLELEIDSGEDIDPGGATDDPPAAPPEEPDAFFDVSFPDGGVELTHTGSDPVPAGHLEVRHQPDGEFSIHPWSEFADVSPDETVQPGDSAVFSQPGDGHLVWRPSEYWGQPVSSGWEL